MVMPLFVWIDLTFRCVIQLSAFQKISVHPLCSVYWNFPEVLIYWHTCSKFRDIFDEDFFIYALRNHVKVVRELPEDLLLKFDNNISSIVNLRVKAWSSSTYYLLKVLPKLKELGYEPFAHDLICLILFGWNCYISLCDLF